MEQKRSTASQAHPRLWAVAMLLCVIALVAGVYLTYTAYTGSSYLKAVATTGATENLFGSDVLIGYTSEMDDDKIDDRSITVDPSGGQCSFSFTIYNYLSGDEKLVNDKDVNVTLAVTAAGDTKDWSINPDDRGTSLLFRGYTAIARTYTVTFSKDDLGSISFLIKAQVGENSPGTNLKMLAAHVMPSERSIVTAASVMGDWVDKASGAGVDDFAAYNYRVTVSGAAANVTLAWDSSKVELDPYFAANHSGATFGTTEDGKSTVTFLMQPGSEIINFFNAGGQPFNDWADIGVTCSGETVTGGTTAEG